MSNASPSITQLWDNDELSVQNGGFSASGSRSARIYVVSNVANECDAVAFAWQQSPEILEDGQGGVIPRHTVSVEERLNQTSWKVRVEYEHSSSGGLTSDELDEYSASSGGPSGVSQRDVCFQCNAGSRHIVVPIWQSCVYAEQGFAMTDAQALLVPIGDNGKVGEDREIAGCDFNDSGIHEMYDVVIPYDTARSSAWRRKVIRLCGSVNSRSFHGWEPGEVFFNGASYATPRSGARNVKVTFDFCIRPNEPAAAVHGISIGPIYGWNYVWVQYGEVISGASRGDIIKRIFHAKVFPYNDLGVLGV